MLTRWIALLAHLMDLGLGSRRARCRRDSSGDQATLAVGFSERQKEEVGYVPETR